MKNLNVKIPDGCKSVSIRVEEGKIITEFIPKGTTSKEIHAISIKYGSKNEMFRRKIK